LLDGADPQLVRELEEYRPAVEPRWAREVGEPGAAARPDSTGVEREVAGRWAAACAEAARPRFRPASVSGEARAAPRADAEELEDAGARKPREGRFGSAFGHTVHRAIGLVLREGRTPRDAVLCAAGAVGLAEHVEEAAGDVGRAVEALRAEGVTGAVGPDLQIEYPVAASWNGGVLLGGYVDIVAVTGDRLDVIDFKSDAPPAGPVEATYPEYAAQVRLYGGLLEATGVAGGRRVRCGLLFTADGVVRWVA
jgi:ATP-dependent helicase/nuclease subunit A